MAGQAAEPWMCGARDFFPFSSRGLREVVPRPSADSAHVIGVVGPSSVDHGDLGSNELQDAWPEFDEHDVFDDEDEEDWQFGHLGMDDG